MDKFDYFINNAKLMSKQYQRDGVKWCVENETKKNPLWNVRGGMIGDEMGLGKTIMIIGLMFVNRLKRTLIVLPAVLIDQWKREFLKTSGHKVLVYHGNYKKISAQQLEDAPIVLTTYGLISNTRCKLHKMNWDRVIYDEGHHLRNKNNSFDGCLHLKANIRWIVSGTPIQNRADDFFNLCHVIGISKINYSDRANLEKIYKNFVIKRTKAEVGIETFGVTIDKRMVEWKDDKNFAEEIHSTLHFTNISANKIGKNAINMKEGGMLLHLLRARQVCILPEMLRPHVKIDSDIDSAMKQHSKIDAVVGTILSRQNGKGKIIFCSFRQEIDIIAQKLKDAGIENVETFDGRNNKESRADILTKKSNVLIMQIQSGCEGLNLQKYFSEVYFVSPNWNPTVEEQAIGRCYRMGQTEEVNVFKFEMDHFDIEKNEPEIPINMDNYINNVQEKKNLMICQFI
jgi:SNF2 family DNA or RNA helicase